LIKKRKTIIREAGVLSNILACYILMLDQQANKLRSYI